MDAGDRFDESADIVKICHFIRYNSSAINVTSNEPSKLNDVFICEVMVNDCVGLKCFKKKFSSLCVRDQRQY